MYLGVPILSTVAYVGFLSQAKLFVKAVYILYDITCLGMLLIRYLMICTELDEKGAAGINKDLCMYEACCQATTVTLRRPVLGSTTFRYRRFCADVLAQTCFGAQIFWCRYVWAPGQFWRQTHCSLRYLPARYFCVNTLSQIMIVILYVCLITTALMCYYIKVYAYV